MRNLPGEVVLSGEISPFAASAALRLLCRNDNFVFLWGFFDPLSSRQLSGSGGFEVGQTRRVEKNPSGRDV